MWCHNFGANPNVQAGQSLDYERGKLQSTLIRTFLIQITRHPSRVESQQESCHQFALAPGKNTPIIIENIQLEDLGDSLIPEQQDA